MNPLTRNRGIHHVLVCRAVTQEYRNCGKLCCLLVPGGGYISGELKQKLISIIQEIEIKHIEVSGNIDFDFESI
jgi:hypothetical protein